MAEALAVGGGCDASRGYSIPDQLELDQDYRHADLKIRVDAGGGCDGAASSGPCLSGHWSTSLVTRTGTQPATPEHNRLRFAGLHLDQKMSPVNEFRLIIAQGKNEAKNVSLAFMTYQSIKNILV